MTLTLPAEPNIRRIGPLHEQLTASAEEAEVKLDASEVSRIDMAALQLLAVFFSDRLRAGKATHWVGVSDALRAAAAVAGLSSQLGLMDAD